MVKLFFKVNIYYYYMYYNRFRYFASSLWLLWKCQRNVVWFFWALMTKICLFVSQNTCTVFFNVNGTHIKIFIRWDKPCTFCDVSTSFSYNIQTKMVNMIQYKCHLFILAFIRFYNWGLIPGFWLESYQLPKVNGFLLVIINICSYTCTVELVQIRHLSFFTSSDIRQKFMVAKYFC